MRSDILYQMHFGIFQTGLLNKLLTALSLLQYKTLFVNGWAVRAIATNLQTFFEVDINTEYKYRYNN